MIDPIRAEEVAVPVFITQEARYIARQFAQQQSDETRARQVHLNTLAVCAVNNYLKILGIPADPSNCDSWNPLMRMTTNVADLEVIGRGRIECRPMSPSVQDTSVCYVPTDVQSDRLAYVVVQIEPDQSNALILGFTHHVEDETLALSQIRPMAEFPLYIDQCKPQSVPHPVTQFTHWMKGQIEAGWRSLDELLVTPSLNYQWRSTRSAESESVESESVVPALSRITRGKFLELPTHQGIETILLIAELMPKSTTEMDIALKILPPTQQVFLPTGLEMAVLDAVGEPVMQAQARDENRMIELGFHAVPGDRFSLQIKLGDVTLDESFVV
ncbi:MAG: DUF1822 family protein [Elainellaceae cyanobacterium]